jgi:hypothetical protein
VRYERVIAPGRPCGGVESLPLGGHLGSVELIVKPTIKWSVFYFWVKGVMPLKQQTRERRMVRIC